MWRARSPSAAAAPLISAHAASAGRTRLRTDICFAPLKRVSWVDAAPLASPPPQAGEGARSARGSAATKPRHSSDFIQAKHRSEILTLQLNAPDLLGPVGAGRQQELQVGACRNVTRAHADILCDQLRPAGEPADPGMLAVLAAGSDHARVTVAHLFVLVL